MKKIELENSILPVDIVLAPEWWYKNEGITFDEDFFYHPDKRVEAEKKMESVLYDRWGSFGLGENHDKNIPQVGPVHLAAGYLLPEMLGCKVDYKVDTPPQVLSPHIDNMKLDFNKAFSSRAYKRFEKLVDKLKEKYGYVLGDVNWGGVLNIALDLCGQNLFMDMFDKPDDVKHFFSGITGVIEQFVEGVEKDTGTSSISVNRNIRHIKPAIYLHSECSHTMISVEDYENFLLDIDIRWSKKHKPFGIHYCGNDPHRYGKSFAKIPQLDFLDVGWSGDIKKLREHLPRTFLNIRLSPVEIIEQTPSEIEQTIRRLVRDSNNPYLTGICCINIDDMVSDKQINTIFKTVENLKKEYYRNKNTDFASDL
ncbi:MAG: hypothetical protein KAS17_07370 [Victivallaceae bacterium]|nr:hypothetical protein [Victivallaceae bacterium]